MSHIKVIRDCLILVLFFVAFATSDALAQRDTLILSNNDMLVGEIKEMNRGVLIIETDYSDTDFKIDWEKVIKIVSDQKYTVSLVSREFLTEVNLITTGPGEFILQGVEATRQVRLDDIVYLRRLDDGFWSKISANVDFGYSITKANNLRQFNGSAVVGYKDERWVASANYRQVRSIQDNVDQVRRIEGSLNADYGFSNGLFLGARLNFLSNTEQNLKLRTTGVLGLGYYLVRTNALYWNVFAGPALNVEQVGSVENLNVSGSPDRQSMEAVFGTELNLYDIGDLELFTNFYWYPSITEDGRNRIDYKFDVKYDLPLGFYLKAGFTLNYDSQPAAGASQSDYVILSGFGWEL